MCVALSDTLRFRAFSLRLDDLLIDFSKCAVRSEVLELLFRLALSASIEARRDAMFAGDKINATEGRAVLHVSLRNLSGRPVAFEGRDVMPDVLHVIESMESFSRTIRSGELRGTTGKPFTDVVNIGIGGSDLGPAMATAALAPYHDGPRIHFVSNVDGAHIADTLKRLDPATTFFVIASKTFTTVETMTNAETARAWLSGALGTEAVPHHFAAVSTALDKVADFGIDPANAFGFWDWVGGRYSVDSAVGLSVAIAIGMDGFRDFLAGFHAVDEHFRTTAPERNVPLLMGLLNVWYVNFFDAHSHAVLPYAQYLHRFPAYLQQLTMESNGKSVRWDGTPVTTDTGEIFWGEPGTNGQHAFYQLIHQGTRVIPADFIAVANPAHPLKDGDEDVHALFLANFFAQTAALAFGKTEDEVRAEGTAEDIVPARVFAGNKPTTSILAPALTPSVVGQLIGLYEHITFVQGVVWGIDSFDQWGVELGKKLALEIAPAVNGDDEALAKQDPSTQLLLKWYLGQRA